MACGPRAVPALTGPNVMQSLTLLAEIVAASLCAVALAGALLLRFRRAPEAASAQADPGDDLPVFLFQGRILIDATEKAYSLLPAQPVGADAMTRFLLAFGPRFPELETRLQQLRKAGRIELRELSDDPDSLHLEAEWRDGVVRIALCDPRQGSRSELVERYSLAAMRSELGTLRSIAEHAPGATWKQGPGGMILWANTAYMELASDTMGEDALFGWPPPTLFPDLAGKAGAAGKGGKKPPENDPVLSHPVEGDEVIRRRARLQGRDEAKPRWFELLSLPGEDGRVCFATPIDRLVQAETQFGDLMQTLAKTFAHLTVGLAIFDNRRQLALFNPALVDLTALSAELLSTRPTLHAFLDALRDRQRIPEPKDYKSWRLHIAQLEAGAVDGSYQETWNLPTGQTYRVTGRPHPDGAVAYVFEDISSEVSLTRSFRSEIELGQAVLDSLDVAIAVFSDTGELTMTNTAYAKLWGEDPAAGLQESTVVEATRAWQSRCTPSLVWNELRKFISDHRDRQAWADEVETLDGRRLRCHVRPLGRGATLVSFEAAVGALDRSESAPQGPADEAGPAHGAAPDASPALRRVAGGWPDA